MSNFFDYGYNDIECDVTLPKPIIEEYDGIQVVRDDLLDGGTKRRFVHDVCYSTTRCKSFWTSYFI